MVKAIAFSTAFVAAYAATLAQGAALKQDPLYGCVSYQTGPLGLGSPDSDIVPANFVAGHVEKSLITGRKNLSVLATTHPR
jgi:hypothetical protein